MFYLGFRRENFQKLELEKNKSQRLFLASQLLQQSLPLLKELGGRMVTQLSLWLLLLSKLLCGCLAWMSVILEHQLLRAEEGREGMNE